MQCVRVRVIITRKFAASKIWNKREGEREQFGREGNFQKFLKNHDDFWIKLILDALQIKLKISMISRFTIFFKFIWTAESI